MTSDIEKVNVYESAEDTLDNTDKYSRKNIIDSIQEKYAAGGSDAVTKETDTYAALIKTNQETMTTAQKTMDDNAVLSELASIDTSTTEGRINTIQHWQNLLEKYSLPMKSLIKVLH